MEGGNGKIAKTNVYKHHAEKTKLLTEMLAIPVKVNGLAQHETQKTRILC